MVRNLTTFLILIFAISIFTFGEQVFSQTNPNHVYVKGYTRKNGTYVQGHYRTAPNSTINDNFSTVGNVNPYTGKAGWIPREGNAYNYNYSMAKTNSHFLTYDINQLIELDKDKSWIVKSNLTNNNFKYDNFILQDDYRETNIYGMDLDSYSYNGYNNPGYDIVVIFTTFNFDKYIDSLEIKNIKINDFHIYNILKLMIDSRYNEYYYTLINNIKQSPKSKMMEEPSYNSDLKTEINYYIYNNDGLIFFYQKEEYSAIEIYTLNNDVLNKYKNRY